MSNSKAFVHEILPIGYGADEDTSVHQTSPYWILTFLRWNVRDTLRFNAKKESDLMATRDPLVVENDCIQVSTSMSKGVLTPTMTATLVRTDINYMSTLAPGDFVLVNMLNWKKDAFAVAAKARAKKAINGPNDGFKGVYKIQSVRKILTTDPATGTKLLIYRITGYAFTEFNNTIYFQPEMINEAEKKNVGLWVSNIGLNWALMASNKALTNGQDIIKALIESFLGNGVSSDGQRDKLGTIKTANTLFFVPSTLGLLLGVKSAKAAKDIYNYTFGIQQYAASAKSLASGFNPINIKSKGRFQYVGTNCQGEVSQKPEYWNQVKLWSVLNQFTNSPLNELYTTFKISHEGSVMPTMVFRQIPFTNEDFKADGINVTRYMNLPRWKIHPALVTGIDIGKDEAARINFVQFFGRSSLNNSGWGVSEETAQRNYLFDLDDVKRSGLRPYVVSTTFDITNERQKFATPIWAKIVGDALIGGHLKLNGSLEVIGIVDPIAVGDNLEFDGVIYHIEEVSHTCGYGADGKRTFRTKLRLSSGISIDSSIHGTKYAEMTFTGAGSELENDWDNNKILPGISESQEISGRQTSLDKPLAKSVPFNQPNVGTSAFNSVRPQAEKKKK